jgi:hypothetical protein
VAAVYDRRLVAVALRVTDLQIQHVGLEIGEDFARLG